MEDCLKIKAHARTVCSYLILKEHLKLQLVSSSLHTSLKHKSSFERVVVSFKGLCRHRDFYVWLSNLSGAPVSHVGIGGYEGQAEDVFYFPLLKQLKLLDINQGSLEPFFNCIMPQLTVLQLSTRSVYLKWLPPLQQCAPNLKYLSLNHVECYVFPLLPPSLELLSLTECAFFLASNLDQLVNLKVLQWSGVDIRNCEGLLTRCDTLQKMVLRMCGLENLHSEQWILPTLTHFELVGPKVPVDCSFFGRSPLLSFVNFCQYHDNFGFLPDTCEAVRTCRQLKYLDLGFSTELRHVTRLLPYLETLVVLVLDFKEVQMADEDQGRDLLCAIAQMPSLQLVSFRGTRRFQHMNPTNLVSFLPETSPLLLIELQDYVYFVGRTRYTGKHMVLQCTMTYAEKVDFSNKIRKVGEDWIKKAYLDLVLKNPHLIGHSKIWITRSAITFV